MVALARRGTVTGVELASQSLEVARARGVGPVLPGSLDEPLPFGDDAFDLALALDVLEHVRDDGAALRELARVVAPGGRLLVTVPQYGWLWGEHDVLSHHHRRYTRALLLGRAAAAGFVTERVTAFNAVLLAPIAVARLAQRARRRAQPASDLGRTPQGPVNAALESLLRAEAALIRRGRDLPAGVSLLAVLQR
jgi:SAM-dependent methyltransferase